MAAQWNKGHYVINTAITKKLKGSYVKTFAYTMKRNLAKRQLSTPLVDHSSTPLLLSNQAAEQQECQFHGTALATHRIVTTQPIPKRTRTAGGPSNEPKQCSRIAFNQKLRSQFQHFSTPASPLPYSIQILSFVDPTPRGAETTPVQTETLETNKETIRQVFSRQGKREVNLPLQKSQGIQAFNTDQTISAISDRYNPENYRTGDTLYKKLFKQNSASSIDFKLQKPMQVRLSSRSPIMAKRMNLKSREASLKSRETNWVAPVESVPSNVLASVQQDSANAHKLKSKLSKCQSQQSLDYKYVMAPSKVSLDIKPFDSNNQETEAQQRIFARNKYQYAWASSVIDAQQIEQKPLELAVGQQTASDQRKGFSATRLIKTSQSRRKILELFEANYENGIDKIKPQMTSSKQDRHQLLEVIQRNQGIVNHFQEGSAPPLSQQLQGSSSVERFSEKIKGRAEIQRGILQMKDLKQASLTGFKQKAKHINHILKQNLHFDNKLSLYEKKFKKDEATFKVQGRCYIQGSSQGKFDSEIYSLAMNNARFSEDFQSYSHAHTGGAGFYRQEG